MVLNPVENRKYLINKTFFNSFTGDIFIYDLENKFLEGHYLEKGKITGQAKLEKSVTLTLELELSLSPENLSVLRDKIMSLNTQKTMGWEQECQWRQIGSYVENGVVNIVSRKFCTMKYKDDGFLPPEEVIWWIDPGYEAGGWTDTGEEKTDSVGKDIKIDTNARKCLDTLSKGIISNASILSALQNIFTVETNSNNVTGMINRISQSPDWNVVIKEGNIISETNYNGDTIQTNATTSAIQGKVYIKFNTSYLNEATNLSIARTMIHELMHAYFMYGLAMASDPGYGKFIEVNDLLFKKNGNPYNDQNDAQHEQIANKYVAQMSALLEAFAISAGIQSPNSSISLADYCKDLAWGGLKETKAYRKYATDKIRIDKHLKSEANNDSNSTKKKGC